MDLERFENHGIELYINTDTGESYTTKGGYSRMSGVKLDTIKKRFKVGDLKCSISAELPTIGGLKVGKLINESTIAKWIVKDNPERATKILQLGIRGFMHKAAGYEVTSTAVQKPMTLAEQCLQNAQALVSQEKEQQRQAEVQIQLLVQQEVNKQLSLGAKEKAEQAILLHTELKQELTALKSFIESRPPAVNQTTGQKINVAIQNLGRILANKEEQPIGEVIRSLWKELGILMRNSEYRYDLNARIAHAKVEYDRLYQEWEEAGKPRGEKPAKPSRITVLQSDEMLRAGYCCTQQLAIGYIS